jgi:hypothetical protein
MIHPQVSKNLRFLQFQQLNDIKAAVDVQWWKQSCGWESELGTFIMTNAISWPAQFLYSEISPYNST